MSDIGSDVEAGQELVQKAEDRLLAKDPKHELIAYLHIADDNERNAAWQKQLRRFSKNPNVTGNVRGAMECAYALVQYLIALETALGERTPKPIKSTEDRMKDPHDSMWDLD